MTEQRGAADWLAFVLICASAALAALLEVLFLTQFYIGSVIVPLVILVAIVGNLALPRMGFAAIRSPVGAVLPVLLWLVVVLVPVLYSRPEGDLFVLGEYGQQWAYYGMLFAGAIAGFACVIRATTPGPPPRR
jgi:hypothetical protein